jgi:hypothetical protein
MDLYSFWVGALLLCNEVVRWVCKCIIMELTPASIIFRAKALIRENGRWWGAFAQAMPSIPDIGQSFDRHGVIGLLFWIIGGLVTLFVSVVGALIVLYKKEDAWIKSLESLLREHFRMVEENSRLREELKDTNANCRAMMERIAWLQRGAGH